MPYTCNPSPIVEELKAAGILPPHCTEWEFIIRIGKPARIRYEVSVTDAQFRLIADALLRDPEEAKRLVQYAVKNREWMTNAQVLAV